MDWDDLRPPPKPQPGPALGEPLATLSIAELDGRVAALEVEIARVKAEIARKKAQAEAANAFFKPSA